MKKPTSLKVMMVCLVASVVLVSCKKEDPVLTPPTIAHVEVGLENSGVGIVGHDFHIEMDVVAGERIETIEIKIAQRTDETYASVWNYALIWEQYRGARNTNVHKHFTIPDDAPEGKYDFIIIVNDQNGTSFEAKRELNIYLPENLPAEYKHITDDHTYED